MNSNDLYEKALALAARPYTTIIKPERTTDDEWMYMAYHPELEGCIAQGETHEQAKVFLDEIRVDYIYSLLEDGLPVPKPIALDTITRGGSDNFLTYYVIGSFEVEDIDITAVPSQEIAVPLYEA